MTATRHTGTQGQVTDAETEGVDRTATSTTFMIVIIRPTCGIAWLLADPWGGCIRALTGNLNLHFCESVMKVLHQSSTKSNLLTVLMCSWNFVKSLLTNLSLLTCVS